MSTIHVAVLTPESKKFEWRDSAADARYLTPPATDSEILEF